MSRVVFMGTPEFAVPVLETLIEIEQVVGVVTQPDRPAGRGQKLRPSPVKVVAEAASIPLYQPPSLRKEEDARPIRAWQPDAILVAAYGEILRPHLLALPPRGCLNVHASLLPRWRGASPIQHALLAGDEQTGISLMRMDAGLDTGPVYVQEAIPIQADETAESLHDRLAQVGAAVVRAHLAPILAGQRTPEPQSEANATYAPMISKEDGRLNWSQSAQQLDRHVRAMTPWPSAFTTWQGKRLKILDVQPLAEAELVDAALRPAESGLVVEHDGEVLVLTGEGALRLLRLQPAGRQAMTIDEFVRGRPEFIGSRLGQ